MCDERGPGFFQVGARLPHEAWALCMFSRCPCGVELMKGQLTCVSFGAVRKAVRGWIRFFEIKNVSDQPRLQHFRCLWWRQTEKAEPKPRTPENGAKTLEAMNTVAFYALAPASPMVWGAGRASTFPNETCAHGADFSAVWQGRLHMNLCVCSSTKCLV